MKRLIYLFLTLFTAVTYGQADFPEGVQISGGQPTTTTDPYLTTTGTTGLQGKVTPEEIPLTIIPPTTHYTPVTPNLKGHFQGIDNAIGNIPLTTAGNTTRVWFTGDATTITAGTFYLTNPTSKGTVANVSQSVTNDDNQKKYFTQDLIGQPFATATLFPPGVYAGNLSASTTPNSAQQRFTVELYKCDNNGTPIASGVSGAPVGDLGVTVILILDSGLLTLADGSVTNVPVSASLASQLSVAVGERIRYHVSAEKVGTASSNITESVWYGSSFNSFLDVPTPITSSGVSNVSTVTGSSVTTALDNLQTNKADLAGATFTGAVTVPTPTLSGHAVTKGYADGLVVGLLDDRGTYNASSNTFPTTGGSGTSGAILKGDIWYVGTAGTLGGKAVAIGDSFRALVDSPGQTASNWALLSSNLSYVPANDANVVHKTGDETITGVKTFNSIETNFQTSAGSAIRAIHGSGANGIVSIASTGATGNNFIGYNDTTVTFTVDKLGTSTGTSFVKSGATSTNILLAGGGDIPQSTFQTALTNPVTGTGTTNYLPKFTGTSTLGSSLIYDDGTNIGIGTSPLTKLHINGTTRIDEHLEINGSSTGGSTYTVYRNNGTDLAINGSDGAIFGGSATDFGTYVYGANNYYIATNNTKRLLVSSSGGINIPSLGGVVTRIVVAGSGGDLNATNTLNDISLTGTPTAPTATAGTNTTQIATTAFVQTATGGYKKYVALMNQTGTNAPVATVLENTLGGTIVWTRSSAGTYLGTLTGAFTSNKTVVFTTTGAPATANANHELRSYANTANTVVLISIENASPIDSNIGNASIEIRVYN